MNIKSFEMFDTKNSIKILENELINDFSLNFHKIYPNSNIFTLSEKKYIQDNMDPNIMFNEGFEWLKNIGKVILDKIKKIKSGISNFVGKIKSWFNAFLKKILLKAREKFGNKVPKMDIGKYIKDGNEFEIEKKHLGQLMSWWKKALTSDNGISYQINDKEVENKLSNSLSTNESLFIDNDVDILSEFYNINESTESGGGAWSWILKNVFHQEQLPKGASFKDKGFWWLKLFLKSIAIILNPVLKMIEILIKGTMKHSLQFFSWFTHKLNGPPLDRKDYYKFELFTDITTGLINSGLAFTLEFDTLVNTFSGHGLLHTFVHTLDESFEMIIHYITEWADHIPYVGECKKCLTIILQSYCLAMSIWSLVDSYKHFKHEHEIEDDEIEKAEIEKSKKGENKPKSREENQKILQNRLDEIEAKKGGVKESKRNIMTFESFCKK